MPGAIVLCEGCRRGGAFRRGCSGEGAGHPIEGWPAPRGRCRAGGVSPGGAGMTCWDREVRTAPRGTRVMWRPIGFVRCGLARRCGDGLRGGWKRRGRRRVVTRAVVLIEGDRRGVHSGEGAPGKAPATPSRGGRRRADAAALGEAGPGGAGHDLAGPGRAHCAARVRGEDGGVEMTCRARGVRGGRHAGRGLDRGPWRRAGCGRCACGGGAARPTPPRDARVVPLPRGRDRRCGTGGQG